MRHRTKFCEDRSNCTGDMADFRFFKMAAAAILDFGNFKFLTVGTLKRVELRLHAKFCRNCSKRGSGFNGLTEYLHNRIGLIGLGL